MKKCILLILLIPMMVYGKSISYSNSYKIADNHYAFDINVSDMELNMVKGSISIPNGYITKVNMSDGFQNKNGNSNNFYFYRDGVINGNYKIATIEFKITDNSSYSISNLSYNANKCVIENNLYFGVSGSIVSKSTYDSTCGLSDDATLKSLSPSVGSFREPFSKDRAIYFLNVNKDVSSVSFNAISNNKNASVSGTVCNLSYGYTVCVITVTAERGNTNKYQVNVYRDDRYVSSVTDFLVHGGTLNREFDQNIYEYKVNITKGVEKVYFTFKTNGGRDSHTTDYCNADSDSCSVIISELNDSVKKTYTFYFINENTTYPSDGPSDGDNKNTNNKKVIGNTNKTNGSDNKNNNNNNNQEVKEIVEENNNLKEDNKNNNNNNNKKESNKYFLEDGENNVEMIKIPFLDMYISKNIYLMGLGVISLLIVLILMKILKR